MLKAILFWGHIVFILGAMSIGFFFPPVIVLILVATHRLHIFVFDGCFLTLFKQKLHLMPRDIGFLEFASARICGKTVSRRGATYLDYFFALFPVAVVFVRHHL